MSRPLTSPALLGLLGVGLFAGCGAREPRTTAGVSGEAIYQKFCAACHMPDGSGVPNFQPALLGSAIVAGDPAFLEIVIRAGSAALAGRTSEFSAPMPPFGMLTDAEVKAVTAYVRDRFAPPSPPSPP